MTTAEGSSDRRWIMDLIAHYQPLFWYLSAAGTAANALLHTPATTIASLVANTVIYVAIWAGLRHERSLCERCAMSVPLDTDAAVREDGRWLRAMHWEMDNIWKLAGILAALILTEIFGSHFWSMTSAVLTDTLLGLQVAIGLKHRILAPWCPQCRWDGGGDSEVVPEPVPPSVRADR